VAIFVLSLFIARLSVLHTKRGYRYSLSVSALLLLLSCMLLGTVLHIVGIGRFTHRFLHAIPGYEMVTFDAEDAWNRPNVGRLAGRVVTLGPDHDFMMTDFHGRSWRVHVALLNNESVFPKASSTVRVFGFLDASSSVFTATSLNDWEYEVAQ
jgi:hypothetical protein